MLYCAWFSAAEAFRAPPALYSRPEAPEHGEEAPEIRRRWVWAGCRACTIEITDGKYEIKRKGDVVDRPAFAGLKCNTSARFLLELLFLWPGTGSLNDLRQSGAIQRLRRPRRRNLAASGCASRNVRHPNTRRTDDKRSRWRKAKERVGPPAPESPAPAVILGRRLAELVAAMRPFLALHDSTTLQVQ